MIHRTCDRCGKQIKVNETYYTLKKEPHTDRGMVPIILCGYDALNNANAPIGYTREYCEACDALNNANAPIGYTPEYCEACVNLAFEALKPLPDADIRST